MFSEAFGVRDGKLWADVDRDTDALALLTQFARARLPELPRRNFLIRGHGRTRPIQVSATRVLGAGLDSLPRARLLLLLTPVGIQPRTRNEELCTRFGLTQAEADVASQFVNGGSIPEIAASRGVAESTIREQMKSIYRKTGVSRQVDLIRLLAPFRH
jgi:DNA-binding CsgD family transcriptional regulator